MTQPGAQRLVYCGSGGVGRSLVRHRIVGMDGRISTLTFEMVEPPPVESTAKPLPPWAEAPLTNEKKKKPARQRKRKNKNPRLR